jgi:hypothetical protein
MVIDILLVTMDVIHKQVEMVYDLFQQVVCCSVWEQYYGQVFVQIIVVLINQFGY